MKRIHLFEFEDLPWFPDVVRRGMLDYLSFFLQITQLYNPSVPLIEECLRHSESREILDLCSGGGGPLLQISRSLANSEDGRVTMILSDKYPNAQTFAYLCNKSKGDLACRLEPVDAMHVPGDFKGMRTMFSAFHHFKPHQAKRILQDAADSRMTIAIFDGGNKNLVSILGIILIHPILIFLSTPFLKPFSFNRLFFTYLLPLIPLCTVWDGLVSILRLYSPDEIQKIIEEAKVENYQWRTGKSKHPLGVSMSYIIGRSMIEKT